MILLVLTNPSVEYAEFISSMIWSIGRPEQTRTEQYGTKYYCGWITHPTNSLVAFEMPTDDEYIHPECDPTAIAEGLPISAEEKAMFISDMTNAKGTRVQPSSLIPSSLVSNILTIDEAIVDGWYPDRVEIEEI